MPRPCNEQTAERMLGTIAVTALRGEDWWAQDYTARRRRAELRSFGIGLSADGSPDSPNHSLGQVIELGHAQWPSEHAPNRSSAAGHPLVAPSAGSGVLQRGG